MDVASAILYGVALTTQRSRELICVAILLLLAGTFLSRDCFRELAASPNAAGYDSDASPVGSDDDTDCCSFCICCHGAALIQPVEAGIVFNENAATPRAPQTCLLNPPPAPFDRPPR